MAPKASTVLLKTTQAYAQTLYKGEFIFFVTRGRIPIRVDLEAGMYTIVFVPSHKKKWTR